MPANTPRRGAGGKTPKKKGKQVRTPRPPKPVDYSHIPPHPDTLPVPSFGNAAPFQGPHNATISTQQHGHTTGQAAENKDNPGETTIPATQRSPPHPFIEDISFEMPDISRLRLQKTPSPPHEEPHGADADATPRAPTGEAALQHAKDEPTVIPHSNGANSTQHIDALTNLPPRPPVSPITPVSAQRLQPPTNLPQRPPVSPITPLGPQPLPLLSAPPCPHHCTPAIAAALFRQSPPKSGLHTEVLSSLDRVVALEAQKPTQRSLVDIATDMVIALEDDRTVEIERQGMDPEAVDGRIAWARWAVRAAHAGLFHEWTEECGGVVRQVEGRTKWRLVVGVGRE
ncbi:uncharacterized protein BDZ99DRAFT_550939 [Mytilinidion resinicola]|uniref:Uncharacterized protein n=1 Tax=Mytilinidion resinicola TaxID=574789 RepID=A0A6A6Y1C4_9PEZI|nr:uncharacterized protein BDZ99DRAFT_550939 [Mytilinidion resinicola]KAF2802611.1 hypothetical protein BDZ99DRAFT_550939 [Mytilinidion resinicola]